MAHQINVIDAIKVSGARKERLKHEYEHFHLGVHYLPSYQKQFTDSFNKLFDTSQSINLHLRNESFIHQLEKLGIPHTLTSSKFNSFN